MVPFPPESIRETLFARMILGQEWWPPVYQQRHHLRIEKHMREHGMFVAWLNHLYQG